jgi:hypothetical protein
VVYAGKFIVKAMEIIGEIFIVGVAAVTFWDLTEIALKIKIKEFQNYLRYALVQFSGGGGVFNPVFSHLS